MMEYSAKPPTIPIPFHKLLKVVALVDGENTEVHSLIERLQAERFEVEIGNGYDRDVLAYSDGKLDVPAQYGVGIAWQPTERLTLAADWLRILWGDIKAMKDPKGFAWDDQPVWRVGGAWVLDEQWTLRAGYSRNRGQIDSSRTVQNLLVPSIHEEAYTAGLSWRIDSHSELNLGYELNPHTTLEGTGPSAGTSLTSKVQMYLLGFHYTF